MAAGIAIGAGSARGHQTGTGNVFDTQSIPAGGQTGVDRFDPYAPVDLGSRHGALRVAGLAFAVTGSGADADDPCSPQRCRAW
jgi:hypothetical protein